MASLSPLQEPLSLAEVKNNLKDTPDEDDYLITGLITAAREYVENQTSMVLTTERLVTETAATLGRWIDLASWPISSIVEVRYPASGVLTPFAAGVWVCSLKRRPVRLLPSAPGWGVSTSYGLPCRATLPIEIDVIAGYDDPTQVPVRAKQAMHLLIAHWYSNRSAIESGARAAAIEVPLGASELIRTLRLVQV